MKETILYKIAQIIATKDVMILKPHGLMLMDSLTSKLIADAQEMIFLSKRNNIAVDATNLHASNVLV